MILHIKIFKLQYQLRRRQHLHLLEADKQYTLGSKDLLTDINEICK